MVQCHAWSIGSGCGLTFDLLFVSWLQLWKWADTNTRALWRGMKYPKVSTFTALFPGSFSMVRLEPKQSGRPEGVRPALHSASIHISSFPEAVNPQPWGQEQADGSKAVREPLNQGYLSPMKLVQLTEEPDLSRVTYLELSISTSENSVGNFGK